MIDYPVSIRPLTDAEGGGFLAEIPDLRGCIADGDTASEALGNIEFALTDWMETAREQGRAIPAPTVGDDFSGKWLQRVPKQLHRELAQLARDENISMNSLVTVILTAAAANRFQWLDTFRQRLESERAEQPGFLYRS